MSDQPMDRNWLTSLGFDHLGDAEAGELLSAVESELQLRVGLTLSEGLTDREMDECFALEAGGLSQARDWADRSGLTHEFAAILGKVLNDGLDDRADDIMSNWACERWLARHCPGYRDVIAATRLEFEHELRSIAASR